MAFSLHPAFRFDDPSKNCKQSYYTSTNGNKRLSRNCLHNLFRKKIWYMLILRSKNSRKNSPDSQCILVCKFQMEKNFIKICELGVPCKSCKILATIAKWILSKSKNRGATVQIGAIRLLYGCTPQKLRSRQYLHGPYLMANGKRLRDTVHLIYTIMCEMSGNCLRLEIPSPTLLAACLQAQLPKCLLIKYLGVRHPLMRSSTLEVI